MTALFQCTCEPDRVTRFIKEGVTDGICSSEKRLARFETMRRLKETGRKSGWNHRLVIVQLYRALGTG
jgi:hypothetical protein